MNDTWYDMGFDDDMSWMYNWKGEEKKVEISESKKKIVIDNYFKKECDVNTSIKEAFTKGFELGLKKAPQTVTGHWVKTPKAVMGEGYMWYCDKCEHQVYQDSSRHYPSERYCSNCGARMESEE